MKIGIVFPQNEIGSDPAAIRGFAQAAEEIGLTHIAGFDHVLGADTARRADVPAFYTHQSAFHEPFVLFSHLAAVTSRIGFATCILVLPQRQTVLVAKQAAALDLLSGGRLRLGVGIGWNPAEYQSLGEDFATRGKRITEQIAVLRALWTRDIVDFDGDWHTLDAVGLNPLPVQRPIPVWLGGMAEPVIRRVGELADGWFPRFPSMGQRVGGNVMAEQRDDPATVIGQMRDYARDAGRDPADIGIEGRVFFRGQSADGWRAECDAWRDLGATHVQIYTEGAGLDGADAHIAAAAQVYEALVT